MFAFDLLLILQLHALGNFMTKYTQENIHVC